MHAARGAEFDVAWREGALGLRFTPNERDEPVICQVPGTSNPSVLASPAAVGDVLLGFWPSSGSPAGFDQLLTALSRSPKPVTLRFRSRERDAPEPVGRQPRYEFMWEAGAPLGVSLAMDPCSLHASITSMDADKISPAFSALRPELGDVLAAIGGASQLVALDTMRFEDVIRTLRSFPRPCRLVFARSQADDGVDIDDGRTRAPSGGPRPVLTKQHNQELPVRHPQSSSPPQSAGPPQRLAHRRMMPMWQRQSFKIDEPKTAVALTPVAHGGAPQVDGGKEESPFFTVTYGGGAIGLQLRDCTQDDKRNSVTDRSNRTNGYSAAVREVTNANSAPGLERASAGDLLMAIGHRDLQHVSFDQVRAELARVGSPTPLLFKKRKAVSSGSSATSSSLVDALLLFLV